MALADEIAAVRDRALSELRTAHDYYADTKAAWRLVDQVVRAGDTFEVTNVVTGNVTNAAQLAAKARGYVAKQLAEATLLQFLATFEYFVADLLRYWLRADPTSLAEKQVTFADILQAIDKDAIIEHVVDAKVLDIMHQSPAQWFNSLGARAQLKCPTKDEVGRIAEAKASRDVLVHNRGIADATYVRKSGAHARFQAGDEIDIPEDYHRSTWELLRKVVADVSNAAIAKAM